MQIDRAGTSRGSTRRARRRAAVIASTLTLLTLGTVSAWASRAGATAPTPSTGTVVASVSSPAGPVLVVGSGPQQNLALYFLTSDTPTKPACTTTVASVAPGIQFPCTGPPTSQQADWPALTTVGAPVAGTGVRPRLLGRVHRADLQADQVTYAGHLLYLFDPQPLQFTGNAFNETGLPPDHGVWYLLSPRGVAAPPAATLTTLTLADGRTVLGAALATSVLTAGPPAPAAFPVYLDSSDRTHQSACLGACAVAYPPVLTGAAPTVAPNHGLNAADVGTTVRADGTRQVTYRGRPLYLAGNEPINLTNTAAPFSGIGDGAKAPGSPSGRFSLVVVPGH
jgi:predicted lipoprotein with Yx(FWY)xxD motif